MENLVLSGPWNHLLCAGAGGYIGYNLDKWEGELLAKINEKRVLKGLAKKEKGEVLPKFF